jgi:UDP-N-acetylmuramate--alanine ligase
MKKVHFIGIGGTGISAIARLLLERGWQVSGTDMQASPYYQAVTALGARTRLGHHPELVLQADLVVRSSAVKDSDPEVQAALEADIPVLKRSEFLPVLTENHQVLAVAGSHGKTTTTAMLVHLLRAAGQDPSFILGADIKGLNTNAHAGESLAFVIEADEYDYMFLGLEPLISVITNIEYDHPDFFYTPEIYTQAFADFANKTKPEGALLICADDLGIHHMLETCELLPREMLSFGFFEEADYQVVNHETYPAGQRFQVHLPDGKITDPFELKLPGRFNVTNAVAALAAADRFGIEINNLRDAFSSFEGTNRRFDLAFQSENVLIFNDYGHHPSQLAQTIAGTRELYPDHKIWAVWEPHTVSRTKRMRNQFAQALAEADQSVILKLFGAREEDDTFSAESIAAEICKQNCRYLPEYDQAAGYILENLSGKDLVIVFSAGRGPEFTELLCSKVKKEGLND